MAGVLGSITAKDWSEDVINFVQSFLDQFRIIPLSISEAVTADIKELRTAIAATAVSEAQCNCKFLNSYNISFNYMSDCYNYYIT